MPMDEYDYVPYGDKYDSTLNIYIYISDNLDDIINLFIIEKDITYGRQQLVDEIKTNVINVRNSYKILESRHITVVGLRICHYDKVYNIESASFTNYKPKWYLINVWRGNRK